MGAMENCGELKCHVDCFGLDRTMLSAPDLTVLECPKPNKGPLASSYCRVQQTSMRRCASCTTQVPPEIYGSGFFEVPEGRRQTTCWEAQPLGSSGNEGQAGQWTVWSFTWTVAQNREMHRLLRELPKDPRFYNNQ